jgi:uncharacterized protein (TIGR02594 family)
MQDLFQLALTQYGIWEHAGRNNNPEILKYFHEIGETWVANDETAWCSAFVNWLAKKCGYEYSGKLTARSWLDVGYSVEQPEVGDLVIFWRENPDSWKGHVGLYVRQSKSNVYVLGGNQSNQVRISAYPKSRLLGYRRLIKIKPDYDELAEMLDDLYSLITEEPVEHHTQMRLALAEDTLIRLGRRQPDPADDFEIVGTQNPGL